MPVTITWHDVAFRLALSTLAGGLMGLDRGEHGRAAGLRTTILVCLAAAIAMIQANLLMASNGKHADSFVVLDLMRLPLGILTGVGFIGAGAILRRDNLVLGVTTAATLWFVTVVGLCFGGGQIGLGVAASALGLFALSGLRRLDYSKIQEKHGTLLLTTEHDEPQQEEIRATARKAGYRVNLISVAYLSETRRREMQFRLGWRGSEIAETPPFLRDLMTDSRVVAAQWKIS